MTDNLSNNKRIAKNAVFLYIRMAIVMVVTLYTTRVILQNLGIDDYGIYNLVYGFVTMFTSFNATFTAGINRYYNFELGKNGLHGVNKVYNVAMRTQALFAIIVFFLVEGLGLWYVNNSMVMNESRILAANWVFQFSVISVIFLILQTPFSSAIMAFEKMDYFAIVSITDVFLKLAIAIGIAYSPFDRLMFYGSLMASISVLNFFAYYIYCKRRFSDCFKLEKTQDKRIFKDMLSFSGWMSLDPIAYRINGQGVNMLFNSFFGTIVNTAFGIANQVGQAIDTFCMNLSTAFRPQMVQCYSSGEKQRSLRLFSSMTKVSFLLFLLIAVPFCLNIEYIYNLWLGNTYPSIAIPFSILFIMVKMIGCLNHPVSYIIMAKGNLKKYMITTCCITSSILVIAYILLYAGLSAQSVFVAMFVLSVINQIASVKILSIEIPEMSQSVYYKQIGVPCFLLTCIVTCFVLGVHSILGSGLMRLIVDFAVSAVTTLLSSYYICMDGVEKTIFMSIIKKIIRK